MARYKDYSYAQTKVIPIAVSHQILPGTFAYTRNYLIRKRDPQFAAAARHKPEEDKGAERFTPKVFSTTAKPY